MNEEAAIMNSTETVGNYSFSSSSPLDTNAAAINHLPELVARMDSLRFVSFDYSKNHTWVNIDGDLESSLGLASYAKALDYVKRNYPHINAIKIELSAPRSELARAIDQGFVIILVNQYETSKYRDEHGIEKSDAHDAAVIYKLNGKAYDSVASLPRGKVKEYKVNDVNKNLHGFIDHNINNGSGKKALQRVEDDNGDEESKRPEEYLRRTNYYAYLPSYIEVPERFRKYVVQSYPWPIGKKFPPSAYRDLFWKTAAYLYEDMSIKDFVREYGFYGRMGENHVRIRPRPHYLRSMYFYWSGYKFRSVEDDGSPRLGKNGKVKGRGSSTKDMRALGKYVYRVMRPYVLQVGPEFRYVPDSHVSLKDYEASSATRHSAHDGFGVGKNAFDVVSPEAQQ